MAPNLKANAALRRPVPSLVSRPSILHCEVLCFLIVCILSVHSLRPDYSNLNLSVALDIVKVGIAADLIFLTTHWMRNQYFSHKVVHFLLTMQTWISSTTELVLALLLLKDGRGPAVETFLLGSAYAKPMVIGALSLLVHGVSTGHEARDTTSKRIWFYNIRHLGYGGLLVVATVAGAESKCSSGCLSEVWLTIPFGSWTWQAVPLLVNTVVGHYSSGGRTAPDTNAPDPGTPEENEYWYLPVFLLVLLRVFAIYTMYCLFGHIRDLDIYSDTPVYFVVLPLASVVVDRVAALPLGIDAWREIVPSILCNYFLARLLAIVAGREVGPARGLSALGISLVASAICLSIPRMSCKSLP
jgi:hypothetical protein